MGRSPWQNSDNFRCRRSVPLPPAIRSRQPCCTRAPQYAGPTSTAPKLMRRRARNWRSWHSGCAMHSIWRSRKRRIGPARCRPCSCHPTTGFRRSRPVCSTTSRKPAWSTSDGSIARPSGGGFSRGASGRVIARSHCWEMLSHCAISAEHIDGCPPHASTSRAVSTSPHCWNSALSRVESRTRHRLRRIINNVFDEIGLQPDNVPERVAARR